MKYIVYTQTRGGCGRCKEVIWKLLQLGHVVEVMDDDAIAALEDPLWRAEIITAIHNRDTLELPIVIPIKEISYEPNTAIA